MRTSISSNDEIDVRRKHIGRMGYQHWECNYFIHTKILPSDSLHLYWYIGVIDTIIDWIFSKANNIQLERAVVRNMDRQNSRPKYRTVHMPESISRGKGTSLTMQVNMNGLQ